MKTTFSLLTIFAAVLLFTGAGCQQTNIPQTTTEEKTQNATVSFEKKQECASYRAAILKELEDKDSMYSHPLDEIFYSPGRDSCLYAYKSFPLVPDGIKNLGVDYLIVDYLTNETVVYVNTLRSDTADIYYNERKEELKN